VERLAFEQAWISGARQMTDALANKGERDRSHISLQRPDEARYWTRHLGVDLAALETAVAKVGNAAPAVRKELASSRKPTRLGLSKQDRSSIKLNDS